MGNKRKKLWEDMSLEELKKKREELEKELSRESNEYRPGMYSQEPRVVSTETVVCRAKRGEIHTALLLIHEDGTTGVKCPGNCSDCEYGFSEF